MPRAKADQRWTANDGQSLVRVDHGPWSAFLSNYRHLDTAGVARVAYADVGTDDRSALSDYLRDLQSTNVSRLARPEQFAFWVNLYNAATVQIVLQHYPIKSIRGIGGRLSFGPWSMPIATIEGQRLSLSDIESRILRPLWPDPNLHYVLNCASVGCPNLLPTALTAENTETSLRASRDAYVSGPRGVCLVGDRILGSSIYNWFRADFGGADLMAGNLCACTEPAVTEALTRRGRIDAFFYDWELNATA